MSGQLKVIVFFMMASTVLQGLARPVHSVHIRAAFFENSAGRQPYKKRDLINPPDGLETDVTVEDVANMLTNVPSLAKDVVQRYIDINGDGIVSEAEMWDMWE